MEWISVEDRLPMQWEEVLVWPRYEFTHECFTAWMTGYGNEWETEFYNGYEDERYKVKITHWMPLPAPPNDEEGL